jgi:rSAM/selenodomain-associated transferase 2
MDARISFIIPVLNEEHAIAAFLQDLRHRYPDCNLIVVDGGSRDRTVVRALPGCDQLLLGDQGRARQMNLGAKVANTPYIAFLHADTCPGVPASRLQEYFDQGSTWGFCRVRLSGERNSFRIIEWFMNQRSRLTSVATGDQMLIMQRALFDQTGGFDDIPLMEDVAYCKRLRRVAAPVIVQEPVVTSSRRWEEGGVVKTQLRMWILRLAYFLGASPNTLWQHYYGR